MTDLSGLKEYVVFATAVIVSYNTWRGTKRDKIVKDIHILTNSAMAEQLKVRVQFAKSQYVLATRLASITGEEGDKASAIAAGVVVQEQQALLDEHMARQAKVDAQ